MDTVYPHIADDIQLFSVKVLFRSAEQYLIGSKQRDRVLSLSNKDTAHSFFYLCKLMDGTRTIDDIEQAAFKRGIVCNTGALVKRLDSAGLLATSPYTENNEINITAKTIVTVPLRPPSRTVQAFSRVVVRLFIPLFIGILACIGYAALKKPTAAYDTVLSPQLLIAMQIIFYATLPFHELGHIIAAWSSNVPIEAVKVSLRWNILPILYVKYSNINFEQPAVKAKILAGGICVHLLFAAVSFLIFIITADKLFYGAAYVNISAAMVSLYPFTLSDGYYLLLLVTNQPNIRLNALKWIFSGKKTKPTTEVALFIALYFVLTVSGLFTTFMYFRATFEKVCAYFSFNPVYVVLGLLLIYCFMVFCSLVQAKKIVQRKKTAV